MYRKSKRSRTLVGKNGRISQNSKKNVEALIEKINERTDLTKAEKSTLINDVKAYVDSYHQNGKKLTENGFWAHYDEDKISRMLTNAGYTADELAEEIGVSVEDVLNADNWNKDTFMDSWIINFNYTGPLLSHI